MTTIIQQESSSLPAQILAEMLAVRQEAMSNVRDSLSAGLTLTLRQSDVSYNLLRGRVTAYCWAERLTAELAALQSLVATSASATGLARASSGKIYSIGLQQLTESDQETADLLLMVEALREAV